jgi:glyoxylase-like metal-dependent hydrolase (beta-lactamase superfamily II)
MTTDPPALTCHLLDTGHCLASEHHLLRGGRRRRVEIHSLVALLGHPTQGWLLWDAGYAPRMLEATRRFPYRLYRWATPLRLSPERAVLAQLPRLGLGPDDVRRVVVSHFHADHIAGLRDFPRAEIVASRDAYASVAGRTGWAALGRGFIPGLLPADFERRAVWLGDFAGPALGELGPTLDLFGDGSAVVISLPGHARGHIGLLAHTQRGKLFFVADACWMSEAYRTNTPPHWVARVFIDDFATMKATLARVHHYHQQHPDVTVLPTHCPEVYRRYVEAPRTGPHLLA